MLEPYFVGSISVLVRSSSVNLGKLLNCSVQLFPHQKHDDHSFLTELLKELSECWGLNPGPDSRESSTLPLRNTMAPRLRSVLL